MRPLFIVCAKMFVLAAICALFPTSMSFAEKMNIHTAKQLCNTARGTFIREHNGKYSCTFPSSYNMALEQETTFLNCTARGECEYVTFCGGRVCHRHSGSADKSKEKKPPKPKPTKLAGPTTVTAGTADQRGAGVSGGATAGALNPNMGDGAAPTSLSLSGSTGAASAAPAAPTRSATGISKPSMIPAQLAERLRRLQQQR
jgi:hypothetical protein